MMGQETFKALVLRQEEKKTVAEITQANLSSLPKGDVLVAVDYSCLNYKDGLAITGKGKIIRSFPMVPGIDLAGVVLESKSTSYKAGDSVLVTGWGLGEKTWGGYAQRARVSEEWLVPMPEGLDTRQAMAIGTAGLTAMLCVLRLEEAGLTPEKGPVAVTGAGGGVGGVAVAILSKLGYEVAAVTGRSQLHDYLMELGAAEILDRSGMEEPARPLESQRWAGGIDTVGGKILARMLAEGRYGALVASCGNASSHELPATVFPFILRQVSLLGVESVVCPFSLRQKAWNRLARDLSLEKLDAMTSVVALEEIPKLAEEIVSGKTRGRIVVDLNR
jgi:acrylyl-CoA reductase (NADPH)